jgi:methyltransferase
MPTALLVATIILFSHALGLAAEVRLHRRNLAILEEHGGRPRARRLMRALYVTWALAVPFAVAAAFLTDAHTDRVWVAAGLAVIGISQLFRRWAIQSLGPYWTMAIVELPGMRPLNAGPYRLIKNPEYISRFTELVGIALATGAFAPTGLVLVAATILMIKAHRLEEAVLVDSAAYTNGQET